MEYLAYKLLTLNKIASNLVYVANTIVKKKNEKGPIVYENDKERME